LELKSSAPPKSGAELRKILIMFKKIKNFLILLSGFGILGLKSFAQEPGPGGLIGTGKGSVKLENPVGTTSFVQIINNVLNYLIYISIPILAIMILIGGFQILTARDNPEKITKGRTTIMYAVIGFVIILISKGIALILIKIIKS
jgi:hypothetical protein